MERKKIKFFSKQKNETKKEEEIENLETISLSDLQVNYEGNQSPKVSSSSPEDIFEFFNDFSDSENYKLSDNIIFCGKILIRHENEQEEQNLSPLFRSSSFHRPVREPVKQNRVSSARFYGSGNLERVNISGLTSMSAKSRRRMFMFGPVKFKPEMELSEIKQRQGRRRCAPLPPVIPTSEGVGGTTALVKSRKKEGGPHFVDVLAKSWRYFSLRKHCMGLP